MDPSKPYLMTTFVTHFDQTYKKVEEAGIELYDPVQKWYILTVTFFTINIYKTFQHRTNSTR